MEPEISREIPIGELIINYPAAFEILVKRGFHCIGCGMAAYETLGQGAKAHGLDDAAVDALVAELKGAVADEKKRMEKMRMGVETGESGRAAITGGTEAANRKKSGAQAQKSGKNRTAKKSMLD